MNSPAGASPAEIVRRFLDAIASRDLDAVLQTFAADGTWQNVPHGVAEGHHAIRALLEPILGRSEHVYWEIVTEAYSDDRAWLERVDRFTIDGVEYAVQCNGVLDFDIDAGVITSLRDYVDLGEWRERIAGVLE